jgi:hypothetical protein
MSGHAMRVLPFLSLDYPLARDTVMRCRDEDVFRRNMTMEDMIYNVTLSSSYKQYIVMENFEPE